MRGLRPVLKILQVVRRSPLYYFTTQFSPHIEIAFSPVEVVKIKFADGICNMYKSHTSQILQIYRGGIKTLI